MFGVLSALVLYTLLTFGAVLPYAQWGLTLLWSVAFTVLFLYRLIRQREVRLNVFIPLLLWFGIYLFPHPKLMASVFVLVWAWMAGSSGKAPVWRFFNFLVVVGVLEALLGLVQYFAEPGWIFGYINSTSVSSGTLINRNHYAGLLEMLIPVAFGCSYLGVRHYSDRGRSHVYLLACAFMGIALAFSLSRSGLFSFACTVLLIAIVLRLSRMQRRVGAGLTLGLVGLILAGALWIGIDVIVQRFQQVSSADALVEEGRPIIYRNTVEMIRANPFGVGSGEYQDQFRKYQTVMPNLTFDHAHNDYLETAAEWGLPMALAFWTFVFSVLCLSIRACVHQPSPDRQGLLLACIGAIFAILVHSLTDFNLQIPSNALLFFIFVGILIAPNTRKILI